MEMDLESNQLDEHTPPEILPRKGTDWRVLGWPVGKRFVFATRLCSYQVLEL